MDITPHKTHIAQCKDFLFDSGMRMDVQLAYECYGQLNAAKDNVILLNHALTGSHHAHGYCDQLPEAGSFWQPENHEGWWNKMLGEGKPLDCSRYFIICVNYLGSCYGSTGPASLAPDGEAWGSRFPYITAADQLRAQMWLLDELGIERFALVAPSVGGLIALTTACLYPQRLRSLMLIGVSHETSIAHHLSIFEQVLAIELDEKFCKGRYALENPPLRGLALARIICHKNFVHQATLVQRAGAGIMAQPEMVYPITRNTESYMLHQGTKFAKRFDANAYIRIVDMWAKHDLRSLCQQSSYEDCFAPLAQHRVPVLSFSIDTDLCFLPEDIERMHQLLLRSGVESQHCRIVSEKGHDSFLLEPELYEKQIRAFLSDSKLT